MSSYDPIVAHRGAWKALDLPENSIASLRHAIDLGCAGSEFDVWMTSDSILVVNHDATYHNMKIENTPYKTLSKFTLSNGEKLPTLEEYLQEGSKNNTYTRLVVEIKPSEVNKERGKLIARRVFDLVQALNKQNIVDYISFDIGILTTLLELNPNINTQYLNGELSPSELEDMGINGLDYHFMVYRKNPHWITEAKNLNMVLNVWTVNDKATLDYFLDQQFDSITTNEPELAKELLLKHSARKEK